MKRSFTYIDDVIESFMSFKQTSYTRSSFFQKEIDPSTSWSPHKIFNIGNSESSNLMEYIKE